MWCAWAITGTDIQEWMGSFDVRICRTLRPALEAKTKVQVMARTKASPIASVRRHVSPTTQYNRFNIGYLSLQIVKSRKMVQQPEICDAMELQRDQPAEECRTPASASRPGITVDRRRLEAKAGRPAPANAGNPTLRSVFGDRQKAAATPKRLAPRPPDASSGVSRPEDRGRCGRRASIPSFRIL